MLVNLNTQTNFTGVNPTFQKSIVPPNSEPGIVKKTFDTLAGAHKLHINLEEYSKGVVEGTEKGFVAGAGVMAASWAINRIAGNKVEGQSWLWTPIETAGKLVGKLFGKLFRLPGKTVGQILTYPLWEGPKQVLGYIKKAEGVGTVGKFLAPVAAASVFAYSIFKAKLKINERTADIDHKFYTGHRDQ